MSYEWEFVEGADCVVATWGEAFGIDEFMDFYAEFQAHRDFRPGIDRLYDLRGARMAMSAYELGAMANRLQGIESGHGKRRVVFLVGDDLSFGTFRQFIATASPPAVDYHVAREPGDARGRLDLPPDYVLPADR